MANISFIKSIVAVSAARRYPIKAVAGSAVLRVEDKPNEQGYRKDYVLEFRIAGLFPATDITVSQLRVADYIEVVDVEGAEFRIGGTEVRHKTSANRYSGGQPGAFRGVAVSIDWASV